MEAARAHLSAHGDRVRYDTFDVTDEAAVVAAVAAIEREFGPLRGVVNSAGIARDIPALETSAELFRKILDINLIGTFLVAREAAKAMVANGGGSIVNIASISGQRGNLGRVAYGSSKAGVIQLTRVMAVELATAGVRVNAIAPGPVETPLLKGIAHPRNPRRLDAGGAHAPTRCAGGNGGDRLLPAGPEKIRVHHRPDHRRRWRLRRRRAHQSLETAPISLKAAGRVNLSGHRDRGRSHSASFPGAPLSRLRGREREGARREAATWVYEDFYVYVQIVRSNPPPTSTA